MSGEIEITIPADMVEYVKGTGLWGNIRSQVLREIPNAYTTNSDLAACYAYGAICSIYGVVLSAPSKLDRLQEDYFFMGVQYGETLTD